MSKSRLSLLGTINELLRKQLQKRAFTAQRRLYIDQITENVINDIDPRLRSIMGYKKILYPCIEKVLSYADKVCSRMPGPMLFSRETHTKNATVRTLFADYRAMAEVFSQNSEIQAFFNRNPQADRTYVVLGMQMKEITAFGMEHRGGIILKDVIQKNVIFEDFKITHPSINEHSLRVNLQKRAVNECVAQTIKNLIATQSYSQKLEEDEIKLKMQLNMIKNQNSGLASILQSDADQLQRINEIKTKLKTIESRHQEIAKDVGTLNATLNTAASLLTQPSELIDVKSISLCVDHFNHIIEDCEENDQYRINLAQITFGENEKRVGVLAIFPRSELITDRPRPVLL